MKNETAHSVSSLPRHSHPAGGAGSGLTSTLAGLVVESSSTTTAGSSPQQQQRRRSSPHSSSHRSSLCSSGSIVDEEEEMNVGATVVTQTHEAARSAKRSSKEQKVSPSSSSSSMEDVDRGVAPDDVSVLHTKTVRSQTKNRPQSVHTSPPTATVSQRSERGAESRRQDPYDLQSGPFSSSQELPHEFSQLRPSNSHAPLPPAASQLMPPPPPPAPAQQHVMRHSPKVSRAATTTLAPPISEADEFQASLEQYQFPARGSAGKNTQDGDYEVKEEEEEDASELDAEEGDHQEEEDGDDVGGPIPSSSSSYLEGSMAHDDCCFGQEDHRNRGTPTYTTVQGVYSHWASAPAVVATAEQGSPPTSAALEAQPSGQTRVLSALAGRSTCSSTTAREELELERLRTPSTVSAAYSSGTRSSTATASSTATTEGQRKESSEEDDCLITFHATDGATNRRLRKKILGEEGTLSTAGSPTASPGLGSDGSRQTAKPPPAILPSTCGPVGGRLNSPGQGSNASSGGIPNIYSPQSEGDVRSPLSTSESPCRASFFLSGLPTARSFASLSSSFASPRRGATTAPGGGEETDGEQENVDLAKSASFIIPVNRFPDQGQ